MLHDDKGEEKCSRALARTIGLIGRDALPEHVILKTKCCLVDFSGLLPGRRLLAHGGNSL